MKIILATFIIPFLTLFSTGFAQEESISQNKSEKVEPVDPDFPDLFPDQVMNETDTFQSKLLNMLMILALLIGLMILASWALKRLMKTKVGQMNTSGQIKVIETRYLSPRATLYLIEVEGHLVLLAESPTTVEKLTTIDRPFVDD